MRISDWSSDVCSSDLERLGIVDGVTAGFRSNHGEGFEARAELPHMGEACTAEISQRKGKINIDKLRRQPVKVFEGAGAIGKNRAERSRSEERRGGKEGVIKGRSRGAP